MSYPPKMDARVVFWAISYHFCLMCSYYIIKPLRDEMGVISGVENLQLLFTGTFIVMLLVVPFFGWVSSRFPREKFLPWVYLFFIINILLFFGIFHSSLDRIISARIFYIWTSVFNLFVISVFWSFMAEIFDVNQAKRLFGYIAAGGTAGGIAGPGITTLLVERVGPMNLLLFSAGFLLFALVGMYRLHCWHRDLQLGLKRDPTSPVLEAGDTVGGFPGGILAGIELVTRSRYLQGICVLMLLYSTLATFLYFQQLTIVEMAYDESYAISTMVSC